MTKKTNFIKISDSLLEEIDYTDKYEIIVLLNICKHLNAINLAWGEKMFSTSPSVLMDVISPQQELTRKLQQSVINSLKSLAKKNIIKIDDDKISWNSKVTIKGDRLIKRLNTSKTSSTTFITLQELQTLMNQPFKKQNDLIKTYLYVISRINMSNVVALTEYQGEFTPYDFEQNEDFHFTFVNDTVDYIRGRKNYRVECEDYNWIGKKQLCDALKELCDLGMLKCITCSFANGQNKGLVTKRNFYYLPCIEEWKMQKVINRYVTRKNWVIINNTSES